MVSALALRVHDAALPDDLVAFFDRLVAFASFYGPVDRIVSGHHTNAATPHWHFHILYQLADKDTLPTCALKTPLAFWRKQSKKWVERGLPPAPTGAARTVSMKYIDKVDDPERFTSYPLKEYENSAALDAVMPFCKETTFQELDNLRAAANREYQLVLRDRAQRDAQDAAASARRDALHAALDLAQAKTWDTIGACLAKHYLETYGEVPAHSSATGKIQTYMLSRKLMSFRQYAQLTRPRGYVEPIAVPTPGGDLGQYLDAVRSSYG